MIWSFIIERLNERKHVAVMCVLHSSGSSPGRQGFKMAISESGDMYGSIGGGIMEYKLVELAKDRLKVANYAPEVFLQVHDKHAPHQSGMICSGEQTIFLWFLSEKDIPNIKEIEASYRTNKGETIVISKSGAHIDPEKMIQSYAIDESKDDFFYKEKTGKKQVLHIVGGGHCALALSKLMYNMDFIIKVYETRAHLNTFIDNKYAHTKTLLNDYAELNNGFNNNTEDDYVVIMTFGYRTDDIALRSIVGRRLYYLGVLGSKKKIEKMLEQYRIEKIDENWLRTIHAPAGLFIKSETPEEIAVSIAAEIILRKNLHQ